MAGVGSWERGGMVRESAVGAEPDGALRSWGLGNGGRAGRDFAMVLYKIIYTITNNYLHMPHESIGPPTQIPDSV